MPTAATLPATMSITQVIQSPFPARSESHTPSPTRQDVPATAMDRGVSLEPQLPLYSDSGSNSPQGDRWSRLIQGWSLIALHSWLNILLLCIPIAWVLSRSMETYHTLVFIFCILSLVPLVKLHDLTTRELAVRIGGSKTGLLNATMGNIVEFVVAFSALQKCELRVVQSSLIGSMLSKLLLVLGLCFFAGGIRFSEQDFDPTATQIHSSLLSVSVGALMLPAAYHFSVSGLTQASSEAQKRNILRMSHSVSIILLLIYVSYLLFQLWSHTHLYKDRNGKSVKNTPPRPSPFLQIPSAFFNQEKKTQKPFVTSPSSSQEESGKLTPVTSPLRGPHRVYQSPNYTSSSELILSNPSTDSVNRPHSGLAVDPTVRLVDGARGPPPTGHSNFLQRTFSSTSADSSTSTSMLLERGSDSGRSVSGTRGRRYSTEDEKSPVSSEGSEVPLFTRKEPRLSWFLTLSLLVLVTVTVALIADWLVESLDGVSIAIRKEWVGLILLPAVGAIAECVTAVSVSVKDQLTLSISVAVGSTIQTALFITPLMVTLGWIMGKPLALLFDPFESLVLYISVQTMSHVVADGKSNWLEGAILMGLYAIIAVSFWFYPGSNLSSTLAVCSVSR